MESESITARALNCSAVLRALDRKEISEDEARARLLAEGAESAEVDDILATHAGEDDVELLES